MGIWEIRDSKAKKEKDIQSVLSKEILCEWMELQDLLSTIENYKEVNLSLEKE